MSGVKTLKSVENALRVIDAVAEGHPVGVAELAGTLALDKSAVQRILVTLHQSGWIEPATGEPRRWQLSLKPLVLARSVDAAGLVERARPVLEGLRDTTEETVMLAVFDGHRLVVADVLESPHPLRMILPIGSELPLYPSASGKAVLACLEDAEVQRLLGGRRPRGLVAELHEVGRRGFATNIGEVDASAHTVAAVVTGPEHRPLGAVIVAAPATRLPTTALESAGHRVARVGRQLSGA